jgi:drug/metabolite transporter (DMT)-like permease
MRSPSDNNKALIAHLAMFGACAFWGLMAPLGKDAMTHGLDGLTMVSFRVLGGCILFWLTSLLVKKEHVPMKDKLMFIGAAVFGLVTNQCCYTIGLSITSPINASIVTTSMPIFAMILAALILKEPITSKKALGVLMGCSGALILILTSAAASSDKVGDIRGDLLCLGAQFSFALYLSLFNPLIRRYSVFTINKWMFFWATILIIPFTFSHVQEVVSKPVPARSWWEAAYVVVFGTYLGYILTMIGQKTLRPTVVSVYNYVQPIVSVVVSVLTGIGVLKPSHAIAVFLVFTGVWLVTKSRSRQDMERAKQIVSSTNASSDKERPTK